MITFNTPLDSEKKTFRLTLKNYMSIKKKSRLSLAIEDKANSYFYIKCAKRVFFVHEKVFYAETKVEAV
jgi:hypothetical protein